VIGSNSMALRQHAYAVFSASRRAAEGGYAAHTRGQRPQPRDPGSGRVMEAKSAGLARPPSVAPAIAAGRPGLAGASVQAQGQALPRTPAHAAPATPHATPEPAADPAVAAAEASLARSAAGASAVEPSQERIRLRAYEIFLARGGMGGDAVGDWLQAEAELREAAGHGGA